MKGKEKRKREKRGGEGNGNRHEKEAGRRAGIERRGYMKNRGENRAE